MAACVALKKNGSAVAWGHKNQADASGVDLSSGVVAAMCGRACVAVKNAGSAVAWGEALVGGDTSGVDLASGVATAMCGEIMRAWR